MTDELIILLKANSTFLQEELMPRNNVIKLSDERIIR